MLWGNEALPINLKGKNHTDYIWPFSYIPRAWTSFAVPWRPIKLLGNQKKRMISTNTFSYYGIDPIPPKPRKGINWSIQGIKLAEWLPNLSLYFTMTTHSGWHFSIGIRYDSVDDYYQLFRLAVVKKK